MTTQSPENAPSDYDLLSTFKEACDHADRCNQGHSYGRAQALRAVLAKYAAPATVGVPGGWKLVPIEPTQEMISAMATSQAQDDEGDFPMLMDLIDFSGENKTHAAIRAAYSAMLAASPTPPAREGQEPAFYGFIDEEKCRVEMCFTPNSPTTDGKFATAFYTQPAPQAAQPTASVEPLFWYRPCRDGMYEGPVHNNAIGGKMLRDERPGEWFPLYAAPVAAQAQPDLIKLLLDARHHICDHAPQKVDGNWLPPLQNPDYGPLLRRLDAACEFIAAHACAQDASKPGHPPTRHCMCTDCAKSFDGPIEGDYRKPAQDEREAFEWHNRACELVRDDDEPDMYRNTHVQSAWEAWQARAALSTPPMEEDALDADELEELRETADHFSDEGQTTTPYSQLLRWANIGLLDCTHFEISSKGEAAIASMGKGGEL